MTDYLPLLTYRNREIGKPCISLRSYPQTCFFHHTHLYNTQVKTFCIKLLRCLTTDYHDWNRKKLTCKQFTEQHRSRQSVPLITYNYCHLQQHELCNAQVLWINVPPSYRDDNNPNHFFLQMLRNCIKGMKGHEETIQAKIWTNVSSIFFWKGSIRLLFLDKTNTI